MFWREQGERDKQLHRAELDGASVLCRRGGRRTAFYQGCGTSLTVYFLKRVGRWIGGAIGMEGCGKLADGGQHLEKTA